MNIIWAFHKEDFTDAEILEHFYNEIINILNSNIDNEAPIVEISLDYGE